MRNIINEYNWQSVLVTVFLLLVSIVCSFVFLKKRKQKAENQEKEKLFEEQLKWLTTKIDLLYKDFLAYLIEVEADKRDLPLDELRKKYGKVLLRPVFSVYTDFENSFGDKGRLDSVLNKWIESNIPNESQTTNPAKIIENYVEEKALKEAVEIIEELK